MYAARFAARLAYTGIGFLLIMNRMVDADGFIFSVTDHAQNGFYHWSEWIPRQQQRIGSGF